MEQLAAMAPMLLSMIDDEQIDNMGNAVGEMLTEQGMMQITVSYADAGAVAYTPQEFLKMLLGRVFGSLRGEDGTGGVDGNGNGGFRGNGNGSIYDPEDL